MTRSERVLAAAHAYGERLFHPQPLADVEVHSHRELHGNGIEMWQVRVSTRYRAAILDVTIDSDGTTSIRRERALA